MWWDSVKKWFKNKLSPSKPAESVPGPAPIIIPPEIITLPSHPEVIETGVTCSIDFKTPDHECLAKIIQLDNPNDSRILKIQKHFKEFGFVYRDAASRILSRRTTPVYEDELGVLAIGLCALYYREDSRMDFTTCLHNGEKLSSVNKYGTTLIPKGRGKGKNWDWAQAADDAMFIKKSQFPAKWTMGSFLAFSEKFNGTGYRSKIGDKGRVELSPYVYAATNLHDETGKYYKDSKYSPTAPESQLGTAAVYLALKTLGLT
jgi:lysozyme family protein